MNNDIAKEAAEAIGEMVDRFDRGSSDADVEREVNNAITRASSADKERINDLELRLALKEMSNVEKSAQLSEAQQEIARLKRDVPCGCKMIAHDTGDGWALNVEAQDGRIIADIAWPFGDEGKTGQELRAMGYEII